MKLPLEISYDFANAVTVQNWKETREYCVECLEKYKDPEHGWIAIYHVDEAEDIKELKKMVKACDRLLSWFGE